MTMQDSHPGMQRCFKKERKKIVSGKQTTKPETNLSMPSDTARLFNKIHLPL